VHIAARIASQATAGEVLVSEEVVSLAGGNGFRFERLGPFELKGLLRPIELYRVGRSGTD
jgi:class 3 adenylate cyclase